MWTETLSVILLSLQQGLEYVRSDRVEYVEVQNITTVPYAVLVFFNNNKYFCTGTIVDPMWVLTSAHCLYDTVGEYTEDDKSITVSFNIEKGFNWINLFVTTALTHMAFC